MCLDGIQTIVAICAITSLTITSSLLLDLLLVIITQLAAAVQVRRARVRLVSQLYGVVECGVKVVSML